MIHFGTYSFNQEVIDYIKLNGDGSYDIFLAVNTSIRPDRVASVHIDGTDAESLREWLDRDKQIMDSSEEEQRLDLELARAHLKQHE